MTRWLQRGANAIGGGLFLMLFGVFVVQIAARFVLGKPLPWSDEVAVILYMWVILWCAAFVVPARQHVAFDLVWNNVGLRTRQAMKITGNALVGGLAIAGLPASWDYVHFMAREGTPVLDVPLMWVYLPFVLLMAGLIVRSMCGVISAVRGQGLETDFPLS